MEKEKILQQLEEKLLPSVQNLERNQATDHDFFPALLWLLLTKSKDSESVLKDISLQYSEELKNISTTTVENNKVSQEKSESVLKDISLQYSEELKNISTTTVESNKVSQEKSESVLKDISSQYSEELKNISTTLVENNKASQEKAEGLLKDISLKYSEEFKKIAEIIMESNKITQEKLNEIIENKTSVIIQKIEEIKHTPLKIEKKFPIGIFVLSVLQLITLTIVAVVLMKPL